MLAAQCSDLPGIRPAKVVDPRPDPEVPANKRLQRLGEQRRVDHRCAGHHVENPEPFRRLGEHQPAARADARARARHAAVDAFVHHQHAPGIDGHQRRLTGIRNKRPTLKNGRARTEFTHTPGEKIKLI